VVTASVFLAFIMPGYSLNGMLAAAAFFVFAASVFSYSVPRILLSLYMIICKSYLAEEVASTVLKHVVLYESASIAYLIKRQGYDPNGTVGLLATQLVKGM
jgi:hypothetical protein